MADVYDFSAHTYEQALKLCELVYDDPNASSEIDRLMTEWGREKTWDSIMDEWVSSRVEATRKSVGNGFTYAVKNQKGGVIGYETTQEAVITDAINSNSSTRAIVTTPLQTTYEVIEDVPRTTFKTGVREAGKFVFGDILPAVAGVTTGIALGKKISQTAYDHGLSWGADVEALDRDVYETLTTLDPLDRAVFKFLWGVEGDKCTAYMDEDAFTYLAKYMAEHGYLDSIPTMDYSDIVSDLSNPSRVPSTLHRMLLPTQYIRGDYLYEYTVISGSPRMAVCINTATRQQHIIMASANNFSVREQGYWRGSPMSPGTINARQVTINGRTFWTYSSISNAGTWAGYVDNVDYSPSVGDIQYILVYGEEASSSPVEGITDQTGATLPNTSGWDSLDDAKNSLQQQYPNMWNNAKHYDYTDENGNNKTKTYLPVPLPDLFSPTGDVPTSGNSNQDRTGNTILDIPKTLIDTITKIINNLPSPNTPSEGTPTNLPPTGSGGSPTVIAPVGTASSLWAVYNPTQNQLNSFGAWLWDSSFVEQIKKLFNDPMQAIIGVHKVFATPPTGSTANIKVGYLDSGVSSAVVSSQYTSINCGTVSLNEYFGNIFDYAPYTRISLYLPFIGIVDLDVADVMRSSITVKYHVDVLTGACLADVIVSRDGCSGVLYQYSGSASVTYPISSGNYMGMMAGVLSVAGGVIGTIATGGALAPALIGGAVGASHLHTDVSHSGGFSGCAGAMAGKKPYLIISRPQTAMADNYGHFTGKPANSHVVLQNCGGMTRVKSVYVGNINATDEEKDMIEAQLKAGVLI